MDKEFLSIYNALHSQVTQSLDQTHNFFHMSGVKCLLDVSLLDFAQ